MGTRGLILKGTGFLLIITAGKGEVACLADLNAIRYWHAGLRFGFEQLGHSKSYINIIKFYGE